MLGGARRPRRPRRPSRRARRSGSDRAAVPAHSGRAAIAVWNGRTIEISLAEQSGVWSGPSVRAGQWGISLPQSRLRPGETGASTWVGATSSPTRHFRWRLFGCVRTMVENTRQLHHRNLRKTREVARLPFRHRDESRVLGYDPKHQPPVDRCRTAAELNISPRHRSTPGITLVGAALTSPHTGQQISALDSSRQHASTAGEKPEEWSHNPPVVGSSPTRPTTLSSYPLTWINRFYLSIGAITDFCRCRSAARRGWFAQCRDFQAGRLRR